MSHPAIPRLPIKVFFSTVSRRFYATRAYKLNAEGAVTVTGEKFDVTDDIASYNKSLNDILTWQGEGTYNDAIRALQAHADESRITAPAEYWADWLHNARLVRK